MLAKHVCLRQFANNAHRCCCQQLYSVACVQHDVAMVCPVGIASTASVMPAGGSQSCRGRATRLGCAKGSSESCGSSSESTQLVQDGPHMASLVLTWQRAPPFPPPLPPSFPRLLQLYQSTIEQCMQQVRSNLVAASKNLLKTSGTGFSVLSVCRCLYIELILPPG